MNILITGNMGYIGPVLATHLRRQFPGAKLIGVDTGYFGHCLSGAQFLPESLLDKQVFSDVRHITAEHLENVDAVVMLAAVSNDPMGNKYEAVTDEINHQACGRIAALALQAGVKRIIFASSCSMYGYAEGGPRKETDALNPLTAYARSKVATEKALEALNPEQAVITSLRFSTACGMSPRLRLDLVLNDFVACALASRNITVLSDGTPWRPLVEVRDMARAIEWALTRDKEAGGSYVAVNVGADSWNYRVSELAQAVAAAVPGTTVNINTSAPPDKRSYRVDFSLYREIAPRHQPQVDLGAAIDGLKTGLERIGFSDSNFRASHWMRLKVLEAHQQAGFLDGQLNFLYNHQ